MRLRIALTSATFTALVWAAIPTLGWSAPACNDPAGSSISSGPVTPITCAATGIGMDPENTNCGTACVISTILEQGHPGMLANLDELAAWILANAKLPGKPTHEAPYFYEELYYAYDKLLGQFTNDECVEITRRGAVKLGYYVTDPTLPDEVLKLSHLTVVHAIGEPPSITDLISALQDGQRVTLSIVADDNVGYHSVRLGSIAGQVDVTTTTGPDGTQVTSVSIPATIYDPFDGSTKCVTLTVDKARGGISELSLNYGLGERPKKWYLVDMFGVKKVPCPDTTTPTGSGSGSDPGTGGAGQAAKTGGPSTPTTFNCADANNGFDATLHDASQCSDNCPDDTATENWACGADCQCHMTTIVPPSGN